ncbi:3-isopropylmalate dehydrogenase [Colletotrichum limetticola]|uniref:3-isopropylmalate dehydrogenase n=1 Tax=Colletotrichum limetticola TaxID=1209924 RepID=A0ABQ9Q1V5_9PEZI|nr:3-isopropylmalate dehydrogenase [Colletotrichum limetticola]
MSATFKIVVFGGDYAGPEVMSEGLKVLHEVALRHPEIRFNLTHHPIGGASFDLHGKPILPEALQDAKEADAILLGAVGGPKWAGQVPSVEAASLGTLRRELDAFGNLRPINFPAPSLVDTSPMKAEICRGTDILIVRELTGGIYFGHRERGDLIAKDTDQYTYEEVARAARLAGNLARLTTPPKPVISLDKANVLAACGSFWRRVVTEVLSKEFPDVRFEHQLVDSAAMTLACNPTKLNGIVLTSNLFGDIISDQGSAIAGSIGLLPSASLRGIPPQSGSSMIKGLYEPVHGSAPDIAGKQLVNPVGMILSVAMMFRYSLNMPEASDLICKAVSDAIESGIRTSDLGGTATTSQFGDAVVKIISQLP